MLHNMSFIFVKEKKQKKNFMVINEQKLIINYYINNKLANYIVIITVSIIK